MENNLKSVRTVDLVTELKERYHEVFIIGHQPTAKISESKIGPAVDVHSKLASQTEMHSIMKSVLANLLHGLNRKTVETPTQVGVDTPDLSRAS